MTVTTPPTFERQLAERGRRHLETYSALTSDVKDALPDLKYSVTGDWHQWDNDDAETRIAEEWTAELDRRVVEAAWEAILLDVVDAMAREAAAYVRENPPPAHLLAFAGSQQLRVDVAALEAER